MPEQNSLDARRFDDELAEFADRLLAGERPGELELATEDSELYELQQVVVRMHDTFGPGEPDPAMTQRIRQKLVREWRHSEAGRRGAGVSLWDRLRGFVGPGGMAPGQVFALATVVVILVAGVAVLVLGPGADSGGDLPGAALPAGAVPALVLIVVALVGVVWWLAQRRK